MSRYDRPFLIAALICALAGMALAIVMGFVSDFSLAPAHAQLNLAGFAVLGLYAFVHRGWPDLASSPLAKLQFWSAVIGTGLLVAGVALSLKPAIVAGAILATVSPILLVLMAFALARNGRAIG